jgi:hypothetical protein
MSIASAPTTVHAQAGDDGLVKDALGRIGVAGDRAVVGAARPS